MKKWSLRIALTACALAWSGCLSGPGVRTPAPGRESSPERLELPLAPPTRLAPPVHWQPLRLFGAARGPWELDPWAEALSAPLGSPPVEPQRTELRFDWGPRLDASWTRRSPSANLYPRWEQLQDQRRLSDGRGFRLGEGSSLGALWTSEDGPAGVLAFRREF